MAGIDVNMGCPKEFSLKVVHLALEKFSLLNFSASCKRGVTWQLLSLQGGMGAALLKQPLKVKEVCNAVFNGISAVAAT